MSSGWIDYRLAEQSLFDAMLPELRLLAADFGHNFGEDAADMVDDFAAACFYKAACILKKHGHRRVFTDHKLEKKCNDWAVYWCRRAACQYRRRRHSVYDDTARAKSIHTRTTTADRRALKAQYWRKAGRSAVWIAEKLGCTRQTVYRLFKRVVASVTESRAIIQLNIRTKSKEFLSQMLQAAEIEEKGSQIKEILLEYWQVEHR